MEGNGVNKLHFFTALENSRRYFTQQFLKLSIFQRSLYIIITDNEFVFRDDGYTHIKNASNKNRVADG
jgi:hypothetical protein